ncbi:hypothetical protein ACHAW6_009299 [Cyclotella cf. meneghiniana]
MTKKKKSQKNASNNAVTNNHTGDLLHIDPARIRYQHSRIRPHFSGCGRSVLQTLDEIRRGDLRAEDLPLIQVLVGPDENDGLGPWYFSLNNRRLWVFKRLREEGLLVNNVVPVRVREAKSRAERDRYTLENCVVDAKFVREKRDALQGGSSKKEGKGTTDEELVSSTVPEGAEKETGQISSESESSESDNEPSHSNPFSALMG